MATNKKKTVHVEAIDDNIHEESKALKTSGDTVMLAVHLPHPHMIDDIPDGQGGYKTVTLPGLNDHEGVLLGAGKAKAVSIPRADWEAILALHGRERMFNSYNGNPPCVMVIKSTDALKGDEVGAMRHGLEPIDPSSVGVKETKR